MTYKIETGSFWVPNTIMERSSPSGGSGNLWGPSHLYQPVPWALLIQGPCWCEECKERILQMVSSTSKSLHSLQNHRNIWLEGTSGGHLVQPYEFWIWSHCCLSKWPLMQNAEAPLGAGVQAQNPGPALLRDSNHITEPLCLACSPLVKSLGKDSLIIYSHIFPGIKVGRPKVLQV